MRAKPILIFMLCIVACGWRRCAPEQGAWIAAQVRSTKAVLGETLVKPAAQQGGAWAWQVKSRFNNSGVTAPMVETAAVAFLAGVFCLRRAFVMIRALRLRRQQIEVVHLCRDVIDAGGGVENDGAIYADSRRLHIFVDLRIPPSLSIDQVQVEMKLHRPDQSPAVSVTLPVTAAGNDVSRALFELADLAEMRSAPGAWSAEFFARPTGQRLGGLVLPVADTASLTEDLQLVAAAITSTDGLAVCNGGIVLASQPSVTVDLQLQLKCFNPARVAGLIVKVMLLHSDNAGAIFTADCPVVFENGICRICKSVPLQWITSAGPAELRVLCGRRVLLSTSFFLVSEEELAGAIQLESFDLIGIDSLDRKVVLSGRVSRDAVQSIAPVIRLRNRYPAARQTYRLTVGYSAGSDIRCVEQEIRLGNVINDLVPGEIVLRHIRPGDCGFFVLLNNRCLGMRDLKIIADAPRVADVQGRLRAVPTAAVTNLNEEADRLMREAVVTAVSR